jgi:hypothetical protein
VAQLVLVLRRHHNEVGDGAQVTDVKHPLMGLPVVADHTATIDGEHDRKMLDTDVVNHLIVGALEER